MNLENDRNSGATAPLVEGIMAILTMQQQSDEGEQFATSYDGEATVCICNDAAENGYEQEAGPLSWLNSARITTDPADDAVHCLVSVGDPRGAFCFTVRRNPATGHLLIHLPHPGETMAHEATRQLHDGTLEVVHYGTDTPVDYSDEEE